MTHNILRRRLVSTLIVATLLSPFLGAAQPQPTLVAYNVVCDDPNIKLIVEQKLVAAIQGVKGFAIDPTGKADLKLFLAVAPIKRKRDKVEETFGLSIATLGLRGAVVIHFDNGLFPPDGYEQGVEKLVAYVLGRK